MHIRYLEKRKYDWKMLEETWKIRGTGYFGDYKFRLILPIYQDGRLVSFQGRDITGKSKLRYKACSKEREAVDHKTTLYGEWLIPPEQDWVVVVEGGPDAWRLGVGAVATYGIAYKTAQVRRLRRFKYRYVLFDHPDPQARVQSRKLAGELSVFDGETWELDIPWKDPGEMPQEEADRLMEKIRRRHS
jgi:DNA primase